MTHRSNLCKWFEERKKFGMNGNFGNFSSFVMSKTPRNSFNLSRRRLACMSLCLTMICSIQLPTIKKTMIWNMNLSSGLASSDYLVKATQSINSNWKSKNTGPIKNVIWIINTSICFCFLVIKTIPDIPCDVSLSYFPWNIIK